MLKLQKARNREIHVCMRTREGLWTRTFIYALTIAASFHLLALLLFKIHSYFSPNENIGTPVMVQTEISNFLNEGIIANLEEEEISHAYFLMAETPAPQFPSLAVTSSKSDVEYIKEVSVTDNPFLTVEEDWDYLTLKNGITSSPPIQVNISGPLAELPLVDKGIPSQTQWTGKPQTAKYSVQVEGKTGRIFWQMAKLEENPLAEQILKEIQFQPTPEVFVFAGEIEIIFEGT